MSYKTRPYLSGTFGIVSNPLIEYEIDERNIHTRRSFFGLFNWQSDGIQAIPREKTSADIVPNNETGKNFTHGLFRLGDVVVKSPGERRVYSNLRHTQHFIEAVRGYHPDVQPPPTPWHIGKELENFVVEVPTLPENMSYVIRKVCDVHMPEGETRVKQGDWIRAGEVIAYHAGRVPILAPVSGRVTFESKSAASRGNVWKPETLWPGDEWCVVARIQPVKEENVQQNLETTVLHAFGPAMDFVNMAWGQRNRKTAYAFGNIIMPAFGDNLAQEFEMVRSAKLRLKPLEAQPGASPNNNGSMG